MLTPLRRRVALAGLLLLTPLVGACGFNYQTDQVYQPATGTDNRDGQVYILNAMVVTVNGGKGTFAGTLVNESQTRADKLVDVTGPNIQGSQAQVSIPPNGAVNLAKTGQVSVSGPQIKPGGFVQMTFEFASGQSTQLAVPVVPRTGYYANVALPGSKSASPSSSPSPSPSPSSSPTASPTASSSKG
ncbi:MAG TPA: hypothetical protein VFM09_04135 [Marmoricola sp.]|nr:hypothetical protein [Marmoricola sp.]